MDIVYVEWIDSVGCADGWRELDRSKFKSSLCHIMSCGMLIHMDEEKIVIASSYAKGDDFQLESVMGQIIIPRKSIIRMIDMISKA